MKKHNVVFLGILLASQSLFSYVYDISVFKRLTPAKQAQYVVMCSDWHDRTNEASTNQNQAINKLLRVCDKRQSAVIVEDLSSNSNGQAAYCEQFPIDSRGGLLGGLAQECKASGIDVANIEFRHCRVLTVSPEVNKQPGTGVNRAAQMVGAHKLVNEIKEVMQRIRAYNDGPLADAFYKQSLKKILSHADLTRLEKLSNTSVANLFQGASCPDAQKPELCKQLLTFDGCLLEMQLLHAIIEFAHKKVVVVFAGGTHCSVVGDLLAQFGFVNDQRTPARLVYERNLQKCTSGGWAMQGNVCVKPLAVDLRLLEQFLYRKA